MADAPDDAVDISGMPTPDQLSAPPPADADISAMPSPADVFKQRVGRAPENDYELKQFASRPEDFAGGSQFAPARKLGAADFPVGIAETAANQTTGMVAAAGGFLAHVATLLATQDPDASKAVRDAVSSALTYTPKYSSTGEELSAAPGQIISAAFKAAHGPQALKAVEDASRATFGDTVTESAKAGLGMAGEAAMAIPGAAIAGSAVRSAGRGIGAALDSVRGGPIPPGTEFDASGTAVNPKSPPAAATQPTPAADGPVTGADLRSQPDPLANVQPQASAGVPEAPAANTPPEAGTAPGASVPVPGKPHIRLKASAVPSNEVPLPESTAETQSPAPAAATSAGAAQAAGTPGVRFTPPSAEGAPNGALSADEQTNRASTLGALNDLSGGRLGEVRKSALSGDTSEAGTDYQHAKIRDAGGDRMQSVIASETNALRAGADNLTERAGSVEQGVDQTALRARGGVISKAIGNIEDWFDNNIKSTYETAKERARGTPIQDMTSLKALAGDESNFAGTTEGEALYRGVQSKARKLGLVGDNGVFKPATIEQAEQLRQYLGEQWTPRTNGLIGKLKDAVDEDVARHGGADLFQRARALRAQKGKMLEDPTGISKLLSPEDRLGINRAVPLEQVPDYVANLPTDQFHHVINVLKSSAHLGGGELADDAAAAIREIKGHMAGRLQEAGGAKIQGGWSAKAFYDKLNQYSQKMPSVFSDREMRDWKTMNDASNVLRMDRTYPGAGAQTHNTGIMGSLRDKAGLAARGGVHAIAHHVAPGVGGVAAEMMGLGERAERMVAGSPEARRLAEIEKRITPLERSPESNGPTLGQRISGASQRGGPKAASVASGLNAQDRFMNDLNASTKQHPTEPTQRKVNGNTSVEATREPYDANAVHIQNLRSDSPGSGQGSAAMKKLTGMADKHNVALTLDATPLDKQGIPQSKLQDFYKGHGFEATEDGSMRREPAAAKQPLSSKFPGQRGGPAYDPYNSSPAAKKPTPSGAGSGNPYDNAPARQDPWAQERVKNDRTPLGARIGGGKQRGAVGDLNPKEENGKTTVNIGLKIGDKVALKPADVVKVLRSQGVKVTEQSLHDSNTEPTLVASLDRALTPKQATTVSALLKQDAIAQHTGGKGEIYGPKAEAWRPFNPDYFLGHDGKPLSAPLEGAPEGDRPNLTARASAADYAKSAGMEHKPLTDYKYIPKEVAQKVAKAYDEMPHTPNDPKVKASYDAFKRETKAQWDAMQKTGLKVDFKQPYPYGANPREVTEDVRNNNHMTVYPTEEGFGTNAKADDAHPMLEKSGVTVDGKELTYNDLFRAVHDYYGHIQEGNGFRGQGEYNAWRNHRTLYSKEAQGAMDAETLGQNAWVNNGPHSQGNAAASQADTIYAEQKAGLLPKDVVKQAAEGGVSREEHQATAHLTDQERGQLRADTTQKLIDAFHNQLPPHEEYAAAAMAGKAKKGWYADSAKAITNVFGPDAPRFAALLASMSPQTSVEMNFHNALRTFINWDKAGRPQDPAAIRGIMEDSSLKNPKSSGSNVLPAWVPNSVRALTSENPETLALSGPKVHSFMRNLQDNVHEVTNDAWMAAFSKMDPAAIGGKGGTPGNKRPAYMAMSAKVRAAAKTLTHLTGESWTPREVQETVWSWAKTAYEHADSFGGMATIPELVKHGEITDELIKSTPDFHQLFSAPEHGGVIRNSRYAGNAEQLASGKGQGANPASASKKSAAAEKSLRPHLEAAAERLESVRQERSRATTDEE